MKKLLTALLLTAACSDDSAPGSDVNDTPETVDTADAPDTPDTVDTAETSSSDAEPDTQLDTGSPDIAPDTSDTAGPPDTEVSNPDIVDTSDTALDDTFDVDDTVSNDTSPDTGPDDTTVADTTPPTDTTPPERVAILPGFCPSTPTAPGLYRGTLAGNLNDIAGACGVSAPGRDGSIRVELQPGQTLRATYRHAGDGVLYLLDNCPVVPSCFVGSDDTSTGAETLSYTWNGAVMNPVYLVLDAFELAGPQTFELDLEVTGP